jgi:predicted ester cyclase
MSAEENKALVRRWFEDIFHQGNLAVVDQIFASNFVNHDPGAPPGGWPPGSEGAKAVASAYRGAFPDVHFTIEDQIVEGDKVVTRWTGRGTNTGSLFGMPSTGKPVTVTGIQIDHVASGKIAETWVNFDGLGMLQQLGVIPSMG